MYVKENFDVKTKADLQNLVTSVVLRQTDDFTLEDIIERANKRLIGSKYLESMELKECCEDTLNTLFLIGSISVTSGDKYVLSMSWPAVSGR